ncbi:MAG: hypothetical protein MUO82_04120 [Candidatus Thermoplasmatota archaeon]|nr:hypothetical protein [Candidatus Thermoplasmatota archaeon]
MNKKLLFIAIQIFILIVAIISPKILAENQLSKLEASNGLRIFEFTTTTKISLDNDFSKPLSLNSSHSVDVTVSFKFELPQFFPKLLLGTKIGNWVIFRDQNHNTTVDIKLNLEKIPKWCDAELENKTIAIDNITTKAKSMKTKLNIKINNDAPALEKETIDISAKFESESNWGLTPSEDIINFSIMPEYVGLINAEFDLPKNTTELVLSPDKNTTFLPVNITNIGNGESIITIKLKDTQQNWNVSIDTPEITLLPGNTDKSYVNITTPQTKERQTMNLTLEITSKSTSETEIDETYLQGQTLNLTGLKIIKEDTTEKIDITIITLGLIVILVSLIIIVFLFKKKK